MPDTTTPTTPRVVFATEKATESYTAAPHIDDVKKHAVEVFTEEFTSLFPARFVERYVNSLVSSAIYPDSRVVLSRDDLTELGIRIGHRDVLQASLERLRRAPAHEAASPLSTAVDPSSFAPGVVEGKPAQPERDNTAELTGTVLTLPGIMQCRDWKLNDEVVWRDWAGKRETIQEFEATIAEEIAPIDSALRRLFLNNKPLPFHMTNVNKKGVTYTGLLLRLPRPDLAPEHGVLEMTVGATTVHELMNRFVIIHYPGDGFLEPPRLMTYRKELTADYVDNQFKRWSTLRHKGIDGVMIRLLRDAMDTFRPVLNALQLQAEFCSSLPDSYRPPDVVKAFSRIQRQASVMERSLRGNMKVLDSLRDSGAIAEDLSPVINMVSDLRDIAEEVQSNANDMMSLRLTMLDFKNQTNMSLFTYFSVMVAPVGVITGWYGMNFSDLMNGENAMHGFYYGLTAFVLCLFVIIAAFLYWVNRDRPISERDAADAVLVLKDYENDE